MSARHSRFEHSIGVVTIASRTFDALWRRDRDTIKTIVNALALGDVDSSVSKLREEMRLAALLHDTGHSLYSHASERVYSRLPLVESASLELSGIAGKEKGAGEALAFCMALSKSVTNLLSRAEKNLMGQISPEDYVGHINLVNVALMIVGRGPHPFLQFLADLISSTFDADKLDYLFRDAASAGLPLRYDIDRYLYSVRLETDIIADGEGKLQALYTLIKAPNIEQKASTGQIKYRHFETYRLRLPKSAINTIEQIFLCKLMLFSYIYHHQKVRAVEGMLERMLTRAVELWRGRGESDERILQRFLESTDSALFSGLDSSLGDSIVKDYSYRIVNRLLPREIFGASASDESHAEEFLLRSFTTALQERGKREAIISKWEQVAGEELKRISPDLSEMSWPDALRTAGVWLDVPKPPSIEDVKEIVVGGSKGTGVVPIAKILPVGEWTEAYATFRYKIRVFGFSEYWEASAIAARKAFEQTTGIYSGSFYERIKRPRS
jgi:HD superfamily phosphohydrolase